MRASVETPAKPVSGLGIGLHLALLIEEGRGEWHARRIVRSLEEMGRARHGLVAAALRLRYVPRMRDRYSGL